MLTPVESPKFRKDVKRMKKRGKDNWISFWDAHIEPDWILIYLQQDDELLLARTGTHADIFDS
jgi:mRNA interferase YafQ